MRFLTLLALALSISLGSTAFAAEPEQAKTLLTERGKLLLSDDFNKPFASEWKAAKGKWEVVDGAMRGVELKDDAHAAVVRRNLEFKSAVIQYSFRLDGAKQHTFSINAKGHLCRVLVSPTAFTVKKDDSDKTGPDTAVVFQTKTIDLKPGEWHTLVIELNGKDMVATLDGKETAFGAHDALDTAKLNIGLTVSGEGASFKNFRVWEATPNKGWEATKAKLQAQKTSK